MHNSTQMAQYARDWLLKQNIYGPGKMRVSQSGCLGRCESGPCLVIYPDNTWYRYQTETDVERILSSQLQADVFISDLLLDPPGHEKED